MPCEIRQMTMQDYDAAMSLWQSTEGVGLSKADSRDAIARYLERNPAMSFVAYDGSQLVGTVLAGHDGRRGYLHHLAIRPSHRKQGIGRQLSEYAMLALKAEGIDKCHLFVFGKNETGRAFWSRVGWNERPEIMIMSHDI